MSGDLAAEVMTGALTARAVEPHAGEAHAHADGGLCLNCGTRLIGEHCHRCGQPGHVHRTVGAIGHELAHGVFHFEGKIWRTLPMLAFRPGELTRRYVAGERARFVSPLALFLFTVFLMFAVVANLPGFTFGGDGLAKIGERDGVTEVRAKVAEERLRADAAVGKAEADLRRARAETTSDADRVPRAERALTKAREDRDGLITAQRLFPAPDAPPASVEIAYGWLDAKWKHARENPKLLLYKMKTSAYKYSWALIPLSLPFIWLLFPFRRETGLYDHAVFATYSLSFMSLLVIALAVLGTLGIPEDLLVVAAILVPPLHLYKHLKSGYRLSRSGALWRTGWMVVFASIIIPLFTLMLLYLGVAD